MHRLLMANAVLIKSTRGGVQNAHLGLVLMATQYALIIQVPSVRLTNPGRTLNIPVWTTPFDEKALLHEHAE